MFTLDRGLRLRHNHLVQIAAVVIGPQLALRDNEPMKNGRTSPQGRANEPDNGIRQGRLERPTS